MANQAHVRIDEGIRRGPRLKSKRRNGKLVNPSPKADLGTWIIPPDLDPQEVLDRYLTEATTSQIAAQYGLSRKALVRWLRTVRPADWKEVQLIRAHCNLEAGEDGLLDASDALSLARMRESVKAAQFRLVALDKDYHPKQEVTHTIQPVLVINTVPQTVALSAPCTAPTEVLPIKEAEIVPK